MRCDGHPLSCGRCTALGLACAGSEPPRPVGGLGPVLAPDPAVPPRKNKLACKACTRDNKKVHFQLVQFFRMVLTLLTVRGSTTMRALRPTRRELRQSRTWTTSDSRTLPGLPRDEQALRRRSSMSFLRFKELRMCRSTEKRDRSWFARQISRSFVDERRPSLTHMVGLCSL